MSDIFRKLLKIIIRDDNIFMQEDININVIIKPTLDNSHKSIFSISLNYHITILDDNI